MEISIALGVAAFCLLAILGLLQTGITSEQTTIGKTGAWGILSSVFSDITSTPASNQKSTEYEITVATPVSQQMSSPQTIYFTKDGKPTGSVGAGPTDASYYRMSVGFKKAENTFASPQITRLVVTWPAKTDPLPTEWAAKGSSSVEVITTLLRD